MAASGLTFLQIVNAVLPRLRESTVAAYNTTDYSTMIAGIVNQVKAEIEEAYYWNSMRETYSVTTAASTVNYSLTGAGMNAVVIDAWNFTTGLPLERGTNKSFNRYYFGIGAGSVATGQTTQFLPTGLDANFDMTVDIYPQPTATTTSALRFNLYVPQADLAANSTVPLCPQNVLIEETIARAKRERGDDDAQAPDPNSPSGNFIRTDLLASAVSRESGQDDSEMDWQAE